MTDGNVAAFVRRNAERGWAMIPLIPGTKQPTGKDWPNRATADAATVLDWLSKRPEANIGIATGKASDLLVIDIDLGHGPDAKRSLKALEREHGKLPKTYTVRTATGGLHLYYQRPKGAGRWGNSNGTKLGKGIDIKADGGQVVAPPSVVDGDPYEVEDEREPVPLPKWIRKRLRGADTPAQSSTSPLLAAGQGTINEKYARRAYEGALDDVANAPKGQRNNALNTAAYNIGRVLPVLKSTGTTKDDVVKALTEAAGASGLLKDEGGAAVLATIASGLASGKRQPRTPADEPRLDLDTETIPSELRDELERDDDLRRDVIAIRRRRRARAIDAELEALSTSAEPVDVATLDELVARDEAPVWRIAGIHPAEGNVAVIAQRKVGKTTAVANIVRSVLTGEPFLGTMTTTPVQGSVLMLNYEVSGATMARWLSDLGLPDDARARLHVMNLRGRENLLATESGRARLAAIMVERSVEFLVVDPFGQAYPGDQNDNSQVAQWLGDLDRVKTAGGAKELVLVVHAGWGGADGQVRARGASAIEDWADSIIRYSRTSMAADAARYIEAEGRDVAVEKDRVAYDPASRILTMTGQGGPSVARKADKARALHDPIVAIVEKCQGITAGQIEQNLREEGVSLTSGDHSAAIRSLQLEGRLLRFKDGRTYHHYTPGNVPKRFKKEKQAQA